MKGVFKIKVEFETYTVAENEEEAIEDFWRGREEDEGDIKDFVNNSIRIERIDEADILIEEIEEGGVNE